MLFRSAQPTQQVTPSILEQAISYVSSHGRAATSSDSSRIAGDPVLAYLNDHSGRTKKFMISNKEEYELAKLLSGGNSKLAAAIQSGTSASTMTDSFKRLVAKALKNAGYANGGVVDGLKGVLRSNGDSLIATVNPGESILTHDFTKMLPDAVDIMSKFVNIPKPTFNTNVV